MKETLPEMSLNNTNSPLVPTTPESKDIKREIELRELKEFEKAASNIFFIPINIKENFQGNYDNYIKPALNHISSLQKLPIEKALFHKNKFHQNSKIINQVINSYKKLILLDLDETLVHAEYPIEKENINKYDTIIRFKSENEYEEIGVFLRTGVRQFLSFLSCHFNIAIFTASEKPYADAIIRYLDPNKNIFKFCLYRNHCINVNDLICIKDLRIIDNIDIKKTVLIDNNIYSFTSQLNNGILINSFYDDKNDIELYNVLSYLFEHILPSDDVRKINEKFFGFEKILKEFND